jgi:hypothetical protein
VEQLPEQRIEAIDQFMDGLDKQRSAFMEELASDESEVRGVLNDLHEVLTAANELMGHVDGLADQFRIGDPNKEPLDPNEYRMVVAQASDTATELSALVQAVEQLMASPAWEQRVPDAIAVADEIGADAEALLNRAFLLGVALIGVFFAAMFLYRLASARVTRG